MTKKRVIIALTMVLVLSMLIGVMAGCNGDTVNFNTEYYPENFVAVDYSDMELVKDKNAFDMMCTIYDNWVADKGYKRTQHFSFYAAPIGATNVAYDVYKVDGDKFYKRMVTLQKGKGFADDINEVMRYYNNNGTVLRGAINDKNVVPGEGEGDEMFKVTEEPAMTAYDGDIEKDMYNYTKHMTTYEWRNKDNLIDDGFKVYKDKDGNYRFTITINCSDEMMNTVHVKAREEFEDRTGAEAGSVKMLENTTIDFVAREIDGKMKVLAWRRTEQYSGAKLGLNIIKAKQTCVEVFSYDEKDYKITDADIA